MDKFVLNSENLQLPEYTVFASDAFKTQVGKKVPIRDKDRNIIGEATVMDESGTLNITLFGDKNDH